MKDRIRQGYSILLNKKTNVFIALFIAVLIVAAVVLGGVMMAFISGEKKSIDGIYQAMLMIIDPGFLAVEQGFWMGTVSLLIVIFGMIVFLGGSIGYVANMMGTYMDNVKMGTRRVYLYDHMLIINWNSRAEEIFVEECFRGETKNILILVDDNRDEISEVLRRKKAQLKKQGLGDYHNVNVFVRKVDLFSKHDIVEAGIKRARTVIILDNENCFKGDNDIASIVPIKILMLISQLSLGEKQTIIVESADRWSNDVISDIAKESTEEIVPVATNEILGRILAQISIMPELNKVYGEIMSHRGKEFYALPCDFGVDEKYKGLCDYFDTHESTIPLNVMEIEGARWIFAMGESMSEVRAKSDNKISKVELMIRRNPLKVAKNIVIIGKNSKQNYIYDCFREYTLEHGENSLLVHRISTEDGLDMVKDRAYIKEYQLAQDFDKEAIQKHLRTVLDTVKVDSILILSNDMDEERKLDSEALIDLINVKSILASYKQKPEIVVEILDPRHMDIAKEYGVESIVFTNQYVSRLITQFGDSRSLYTFFSDLFSYDTDLEEIGKGNFRSKELYVRDVNEVFDRVPEPMKIRDFVASTFLSSIEDNPLIVLGYFEAGSKKMRLFGKNMSDVIKLCGEDKLIVYCRH